MDCPILKPFSKSPVLTKMYGSEERFQTLFTKEVEALESADTILEFLKKKAFELGEAEGGKALEWISAELLKAFGVGGQPSDLEQIQLMLEEVAKTQQLILGKLEELLREVQFSHLITRSFESQLRITNMFDGMQRLSKVRDTDEREREAYRLKEEALSSTSGAMLSLKAIIDVMLGKDPAGQGDPLIQLFAARWYLVYADRQLKPNVPAKTYSRQLMAWLRGVFVIEYMGMAVLANARIANGDFELLKLELDEVTKRMELQRNLTALQVPHWDNSWPEALFDEQWYVIGGHRPESGERKGEVLYGSPHGQSSVLNYSVQFRSRHRKNGDEEWQFIPTGLTDTFSLIQRSRPKYIRSGSGTHGKNLRMEGGSPIHFRIVMAPATGNSINLNVPLGNQFLPVFGLVDFGEYMEWNRIQNLVNRSPFDKAVRLFIDTAINTDR